jgi:hypothetical protein
MSNEGKTKDRLWGWDVLKLTDHDEKIGVRTSNAYQRKKSRQEEGKREGSSRKV